MQHSNHDELLQASLANKYSMEPSNMKKEKGIKIQVGQGYIQNQENANTNSGKNTEDAEITNEEQEDNEIMALF